MGYVLVVLATITFERVFEHRQSECFTISLLGDVSLVEITGYRVLIVAIGVTR